MEKESFENKQIANIMNKSYINIKVDREERPTVDKVYMSFIQSTTGHGGWPMSIFLTPNLEPFFGGTYYAPEDKFGRPGFSSILEHISKLYFISVWIKLIAFIMTITVYSFNLDRWEKDPLKIQESGSHVIRQMKESLQCVTRRVEEVDLKTWNYSEDVLKNLIMKYDSKFGGISE